MVYSLWRGGERESGAEGKGGRKEEGEREEDGERGEIRTAPLVKFTDDSLLVELESKDSSSFMDVVLFWDQTPQHLTLQEEKTSVTVTTATLVPALQPCDLQARRREMRCPWREHE